MKFTINLVALLLWVLILSSSVTPCIIMASSLFIQDYSEQTAELLKRLTIKEVKRPSGEVLILPPDIKIQKDVQRSILGLASQTNEARIAVIHFLIGVVDDKTDREEAMLSRRWALAVEILGELRAIEATNVLIKNLSESGSLVNISPSTSPAQDALVKIGEPAIPQLINALGNKGNIRREVVETLSLIGHITIPQLLDALSNSNPLTRGGAALVLGKIGGRESTDAIRQAMSKEQNSQAKADFSYALDYIRKYRE